APWRALPTSSCRKQSGSRGLGETQIDPHMIRPCAFAQHMAGMHGAEAQKMPLSWIDQCANLGESCMPTFAAGKLIFGCVRTTSATDLPRSSSTGVARKAWTSLRLCGPASSNAMPEICPRSLMLLAETTKRWELAGNKVLRSIVTPFRQMRPRDQLVPFLELKELPTTWPRLLMLVAKEAISPRRRGPRLVTVLFCQRAAKGVPPELTACPTIWPWLLIAKAMALAVPRL